MSWEPSNYTRKLIATVFDRAVKAGVCALNYDSDIVLAGVFAINTHGYVWLKVPKHPGPAPTGWLARWLEHPEAKKRRLRTFMWEGLDVAEPGPWWTAFNIEMCALEHRILAAGLDKKEALWAAAQAERPIGIPGALSEPSAPDESGQLSLVINPS